MIIALTRNWIKIIRFIRTNSCPLRTLPGSAADVAIQAAVPDESPACPAGSRSFGILALIITYIGNSCVHNSEGGKDGEARELNLHGT